MTEPLHELLGSTLEKIFNACNTRKLYQLRQDSEAVYSRLDSLLSNCEPGPAGVVVAAEEALQPQDPNVSESSSKHETETPKKEATDESVSANNQADPDDTPAAAPSSPGKAEDPQTKPEQKEGHPEQKLLATESDVDTVIEHEDHDTEGEMEGEDSTASRSKADGQAVNNGSRAPGVQQGDQYFGDSAAAVIFPVFQSAIDTKRPNLSEIVVDCLQRLVAHRHARGVVTSVGTSLKSSASQQSMMDGDEEAEASITMDPAKIPYYGRIIDMICRCDDIQDDGVELKVLKALLTAVTSTTFCVHGQGLLLSIRTCYNIYLMSRSQVNQTTAKASLTQMLNVVFQRMEANQQDVPVSPIVVSDVLGLPAAPPHDTTSVSGFVQTFVNKVVSDTIFAPSYDDVRQSVAGAFDRRIVEGDASESDSELEHIEWRDGNTAVEVSHSRVRTADQLPMSPVIQANVGPSVDAVYKENTDVRGGVLQKDAFLVFRALCKLSIRTSPETPVLDSTAVRGKVLALELVKVLLENSGPVFSCSERFMGAIRQYLCLSLLKNCASPIPQALSLSCSIFMTLVSKFRQALKAEIAVFFPMILLKPIEPQIGNPTAPTPTTAAVTTSYAHQLVVLRCVEAKCTDGQLLVDLFVNYDCDLENANLFERMIMALVRKAQGSGHTTDLSEKSQQQEAILRQEALRSMVNILWALVSWYQKRGADEGQVQPVLKESTVDADSVEDSSELSGTQNGRKGLDGPASDPSPMPAPSPTRLSPFQQDMDETAHSAIAAFGDTAKGAELTQIREYKTRLLKGIALFNKSPKKGMEFLLDEGVLADDPDEIASFFGKTDGLNKTMIGEFLGDMKEMCIMVMHAYVDALDFTGMELDVALRAFLSGFRLPGEAQKIDRLMEKFAERFLKCNPGAFKSADVAYVLSYSMIMLNTDAHNDQVKNKMTKEGFVRNNRGINDDADLPEEYLGAIYDRIVENEIKMRDDSLLDGTMDAQSLAQNNKALAWRDLFLGLIPGRRQAKLNEPSDEAIRRTQEYLREKAKGATFFEATEWDTVRPMLEVAWAPMLGAFSVLFEQFDDQHVVALCLDGFQAAINITAQLGMSMLRNTFVSSACRFTLLHAPTNMRVKNGLAFKSLLEVCDQVGDHLQENWTDVLRCVSKWEQLYQSQAGGPTDALLFAASNESSASEPATTTAKLRMKFRQLSRMGSELPQEESLRPARGDSFSESTLKRQSTINTIPAKEGEWTAPPQVLLAVDIQNINRLFVNSELLDSEAIVDFVKSLCMVSREELDSTLAPRVFSLTKIVEISHFNMKRIRLVWSRIWAILSDFFISVGCQGNLQLAMYAVDSLRQLSMKFLERDELANYTFQNDFLKPFVVVMRQSKAVEIRELIIRCVSQMVLARVANVKSGWKSMFMVFTTAAGDEQPTIVRLAFETIEKIVREHFNYITETETTTFTDCVNCLIAFTNNPHSLDVALNSIAFLRYCAIKLAEGSIGDVEELPENTAPIATNITRIVPAASAPAEVQALARSRSFGLRSRQSTSEIERSRSLGPKGIRFIDKDEHMYFWFPLLAGLSELTFDPRQEIRSSALEVLFDTLKFHGKAFAGSFWARILDSVLLPIFDHVRAEVTDTTTFTDDKLRAQIDSWLYETCIKCLQHLVDLYLQFYPVLSSFVDRLFLLLSNFMRRPHQSLASMGVAATVRLINNAGEMMDKETWAAALAVLEETAAQTRPAVVELITPPERFRRQKPSVDSQGTTAVEPASNSWTLRFGIGSRRLLEVRSRGAVQLLLVQAVGEIYASSGAKMDPKLMLQLLRTLKTISDHARAVDSDQNLRQGLAVLQAEDRLSDEMRIMDPPLLRLECEGSHSYLSMLLHLSITEGDDYLKACDVETRMVDVCLANLERFDGRKSRKRNTSSDPVPKAAALPSVSDSPRGRVVAQTSEGAPVLMASTVSEYSMYSPLVVATLRALNAFPEDIFKRHLKRFYPVLTELIACEHAPLEMHQALSDVFAQRIGPLIM
ncbi:hypothetical protein BSKO_00340 [Bryopsis sp. KO-2023]|nr:hypothetical protein BSKO_00340 [Bryopsis sp. KO-2023]